jgi:hypothetical protein
MDFANRMPKTANKLAYDTGLSARLWQMSSDLVALSPATPDKVGDGRAPRKRTQTDAGLS